MSSGSAPETTISIIPLGGLGEIGLNMMVIETETASLIVDAGLMFPEDHMLGVDTVIPDMSYLEKRRDQLLGVVITHGHEDHIGALPYLLRSFRLPVYATRFSLELIREKLREHKDLTGIDFRLMEPGAIFTLGPFEIDPIPVPHSIPDGMGLAIQTPVGRVVHSGDFKMDEYDALGIESDWDRFADYGDRGVLVLLSDSTNVERRGHTVSEGKVTDTFREIFSRCPGRIILAVFASNLIRIRQAVELSLSMGRKVAFAGKSMLSNVAIAKDLGYLEIPSDMEISCSDASRVQDKEVTLITTGSQGEPMSALSLMALKKHRRLSIRPTDTVILSSRFIPGHEKAITEIINLIYRQGAEVIYEDVSEIHASGHAYRDEQRDLIRMTRPQYFVPIHGEYRHLVKHARLARECGLPEPNVILAENGDRIRFDGVRGFISEPVDTGRVFVDGKGVGDVGHPVLRDRRHLSTEGMVMVVAAVDQKTGGLLSDPEVATRGLILEEHEEDFLENARRIVREVVEEYQRNHVVDWTEFKQDVSRGIRRYANRMLDRRPLVLCAVTVM